ncbi:MAG: RNA polymerase sigma factor [Candidatus Dojkabacteria bacterium]
MVMNVQTLQKEKELLEKAQQDKNSFEGLYKYFLDDVYRFTYSILQNRENSEDVCAKVFIDFYNKIDSFEWRGISIKSWLFTTARNHAYNTARNKVTEEYNDEYHSFNEYEISFVDEIMQKDLLDKIREEIAHLNAHDREVITLRIWEGLAFSEVASIISTTENAAKKRFYRAIDKLKERLEQKKIFSAVPLPVLFTGILQQSDTATLKPSLTFKQQAFSQILTQHQKPMNTTLTTMKTFLTSNLGIGLIAGTVVLTGAGVGTWAYTASQSDDKDQTNTEQTNTTTNTETKDENSLLYKNEEFGFQFAYHDQFAVVEDTPADAQEYIVLQLGHSMDARYNGMLTFISKDEALISKNTFDTKGKNLSDLEIAAILATSNQCFEVTSFSQENFGANEWIHGSTQGPCDVMEEGKTFEYHVYAKEMSNGYYAIWNRTDYVDGDSPQSVTLALETFKEITDEDKPSDPQSQDAYEVVLKENPNDTSLTDIYLKNLSAGNEEFYITQPDVYRNHFRAAEYKNQSLYIIKRTGDTSTTNWTDELWKYESANDAGLKLFTGQGLDFNASYNGKFVVINYDGMLTIINETGTKIQSYGVAELGLSQLADSDMLTIELLDWSSDSSAFWGGLTITTNLQGFYRINTATWDINTYETQSLNIGPEYALNPDNGLIAYSDYPAILDTFQQEEFEKSGKNITLQVYNLTAKNQTKVDTAVAKKFEPKWISDKTLEYNDPKGNGRVKKTIP